MTQPPAYNDVFISYSRRDAEFVKRFVTALYEYEQHNIWVDWEDIEYAEDWWNKIESGIESADNFVFILTPDSVRSEVCFKEVNHAVENGKRIIPILHREIVEQIDFEKMHPTVSQHNWLPFRHDDDFDEAMRALLDTINSDPAHVKYHTRLLTRAREWEASGKNRARLLRGADIDTAAQWQAQATGKDPAITQLQADYIHASRTLRRRQSMLVFMGTVAFGVISFIAAIIALIVAGQQSALRQEAVENERAAQSLALVAYANDAEELGNWPQVLPLLLEANQNPNVPSIVRRELFEAANRIGIDFELDVRNLWANAEAPVPVSIRQVLFTNDFARVLVLAERTQGSGLDTTNAVTDVRLGLWTISDAENEKPTAELVNSWTDLSANVKVAFNNGFILFTTSSQSTAAEAGRIIQDVIHIVNSKNGEDLRMIDISGRGSIRQLIISESGTRFAGLFDAAEPTVVVWDVIDGSVHQEFAPKTKDVQWIAIDPEGAQILTTATRQINLWDINTAYEAKLRNSFDYSYPEIVRAVFSRNGNNLLTWGRIGGTNELTLWQLTANEILAVPVTVTRGNIGAFGFTTDSLNVWFQGENRINVYRIFNGEVTTIDHITGLRPLIYDQNAVRRSQLGFFHDSAAALVYRSNFGNLNLARTLPEVKRTTDANQDEQLVEDFVLLSAVEAPSGDDSVIVLSNLFDEVHRWNFNANNAKLLSNNLPTSNTDTFVVNFVPLGNGLHVLGTFMDAEMNLMPRIIELDAEDPLATAQDVPVHDVGADVQVFPIFVAPDSQTAVAVLLTPDFFSSDDALPETIAFFDLISGQVTSSPARFDPDSEQLPVFSADSSRLLLQTAPDELALVDTASGAILETLSHEESITAYAINPTNSQIALGLQSGRIILHNDNDDETALFQHTGPVRALAFNSDGEQFVSSGSDNNILLWNRDADDPWSAVPVPRANDSAAATMVIFSPDGRYVISATAEGVVEAWSPIDEVADWVCNNRVVRELSESEKERYGINDDTPVCDS